MKKQLAVIIPVKDEVKTLAEIVSRVNLSLHKYKISHNIIIVDDHSTDGSWELAKKLQKKFPVIATRKVGKPGKTYSILEGVEQTDAPYIAFIDADLQYPPEALPAMFAKLKDNGLVIGKRMHKDGSAIRRFVSKAGRTIIGRFIYGVPYDIQSGLKVFKREVIENLDKLELKPWSLDLPMLLTAINMDYKIDEFDIPFLERKAGNSKIALLSTTWELFTQALLFRMQGLNPVQIFPSVDKKMIDAGIIHKNKRYITHTTLTHNHSALVTITLMQKVALTLIVLFVVLTSVLFPLQAAIGVVAILSFIYFLDVCFNFILIMRSLYFPPEISIEDAKIKALKDSTLPIYTILCPLYKEAHVLPDFIESIEKIDWPKNKLDVQLLLEADDMETINAAKQMKLPKYIKINVVPDSQPKTKPKACNYGLAHAKGDYLVIYDAEDRPDPQQLKKVYIAFQELPQNVKCIQAKLNYYNPTQNVLTRLFTAEYSLWFDVILTGLQSIETSIPLGGTSNHFRTHELQELQGWDPFNVTEDADLGIRLFKRGARTAVIDSVTYEEANSDWFNWLRQRSRWIKGYIQTYLVHMRHPIQFIKDHGWHAIFFHLSVGGKIAFLFINPFMWVLTLSYFTLYAFVGPTIEQLYPSIIFYMAVISLVFGNFMFLYYYMIGVAKRSNWPVMKFVFLVPFYWLWTSVAAFMGLYQLITKPHYWEKTNHGLHKPKTAAAKNVLTPAQVETVVAQAAEPITTDKPIKFRPLDRFSRHFTKQNIQAYRGAGFLVAAAMFANIVNMASNLYWSNELSFSEFALINTFSSIIYLVNIPLNSLSSAVNQKTSYMMGKFNINSAKKFFSHLITRGVLSGFVISALLIICMPLFGGIFKDDPVFPIFMLVPAILAAIVMNISEGYLRGRLLFGAVGIATIVEPLVRLGTSYAFDFLGWENYMVAAIPISIACGAVAFYLLSLSGNDGVTELKEYRLSFSFLSLAFIARLSSITFFSLDNIFAAYFLSASDAGRYGFLGVIGKVVFFASTLLIGFVLPLVSNREGKGKQSDDILSNLLLMTSIFSLGSYVIFGIILPIFGAQYFGEKVNAIKDFLPQYCLGIAFYSISQTLVFYHLAKKQYIFSVVAFSLAIFQILLFLFFHDTLAHFVLVMSIVGVFNTLCLLLLHKYYEYVAPLVQNIQSFFDLFSKVPKKAMNLQQKDSYRILFFNWRDTKHTWGGGAETYIQEIAERLVKSGHKVTIFCGNDNKSSRNEVVNGVQIVRRGGNYTVYFWAFIYYVLRFRKYFDIVIDCENGIPFLTPLYVRKPIFLLIHHIHQEVFRRHLMFPFSEIAAYIESDVMTFLYRNHHILTVSESSKQQILALGLGTEESIDVVNPGIETKIFKRKRKTTEPTLVYIGRLKPYKNVHVAIKAFRKVLDEFPTAIFTIAGDGESMDDLQKLVKNLDMKDSVKFLGLVTDEQKADLFARSWVAVQPSTVEGWGITVIEANAAGTPVIASHVKGLQESVVHEETGLLVPVNQVKMFSAAIIELFSDKRKRSKLSTNALKWSKKFSWDKSTRNFCAVMEKRVERKIMLDELIEAAPSYSEAHK